MTDVTEPVDETTEDMEPAEPERRVVMVEWVNEPPHGTELHGERSISRSEAKQGWGLTISKDLRWTRENGFRLPVEGNENALTPEVLERLAEDPKFKLHYETVREPAPAEEE